MSLQIHAGPPPVTVAVDAGNSLEIVWHRWSREFERSKIATAVPVEGALREGHRAIANARVPGSQECGA